MHQSLIEQGLYSCMAQAPACIPTQKGAACRGSLPLRIRCTHPCDAYSQEAQASALYWKGAYTPEDHMHQPPIEQGSHNCMAQAPAMCSKQNGAACRGTTPVQISCMRPVEEVMRAAVGLKASPVCLKAKEANCRGIRPL